MPAELRKQIVTGQSLRADERTAILAVATAALTGFREKTNE
jgi:hypothetical protein